MFRRSSIVAVSFLVLVPAWSAWAVPEGLVLYWPFNEGQGTVAKDLSGNGNDGALEGGVSWVPGMLRLALEFNGANAVVRGPHLPFNNRSFTHALWVNPSQLPGDQSVFSQYQASSANQGLHYRISAAGGLRMGFYSNDLDLPAGTVRVGQWYHLTFWYDVASQSRRVYVDGKRVAEGSAPPYQGTAGDTLVGTFWRPDRADRVPEWFNGMIDDVQVYDRALTEEEILGIMQGLTDPRLAYDPVPADGSLDLPRETALSWAAGDTATTHDVYFGTVFADVNEATRADPRGVLVSQGQAEIGHDPDGLLDFGTTYYWRIDEVGEAGENAIAKGDVWSFTVEPYAYPITGVTATASSAQPGMGPENAVNGSGIDSLDQHSTVPTDMWLTTGSQPAWIQFEFDKVYTLHEMWVWNVNQEIESFVGFGARNVTIECSADGQTWTDLDGVLEFARASGMSTYMANTTVAFDGAAAQYVRLTIDGNWGGAAPQTGLSEVRFFYRPMQAYRPEPADGATEVSIHADLTWWSGREATSHSVYLGTNQTAVAGGTAPSETVADHRYTPASLDFATEYFWKIDEVGDAGAYPGSVWSFMTQEFAAIDDFESYNDDDNRIYDTWIDGLADQAKGGSQVGYDVSPFAERTIVHGGGQSMPLAYDNSASPFYSEAERAFDGPQDWTIGGADSLQLYFMGDAANAPQTLYVTLADSDGHVGTVPHVDADGVLATEWQQWRIPLGEFGGVSPAKVKKMTIGVGNRTSPAAGGSGTIYLDDIGFGRSLSSN